MLSPIDLKVSPLAASPLPIGLDTIKAHLRYDGSMEDALLSVYARAAISWAEGYMHRTIFSRSHSWTLRDFPRNYGRAQEIRLPRGKTQSVGSIVYKNGDATTTLLGPSSGSPAGTDWQEDLRGDDGAVLIPAKGQDWPSVDPYDFVGPVVINFVAGWDIGAVPDDIIHAIMFTVADFFESRSQAGGNGAGGNNIQAREALLSGWTLSRIY